MRARRALAAVLSAGVLVLLAACGGEEGAGTTSTTTGTDDHAGHGGQAGHNMGVESGTVADVAALGPGPGPEDRWEVPIGLNVCGRFVEAPTGGPIGGVTANRGGVAAVSADGDDPPTLGDYAAAAGITLGTDEIGLPDGVTPDGIEVGDTEVALDGVTFRSGEECGTTRAEVQAWVYSAEAVTTGEGILTVVTDPQDVPFAEDGMALVIAFTPESSLPTLPPSAIGLG